MEDLMAPIAQQSRNVSGLIFKVWGPGHESIAVDDALDCAGSSDGSGFVRHRGEHDAESTASIDHD
jgi:hypothetical protein